jgi:hypothetical protein
MNFILTGFRQDAGFRVFEFEGIGADKSRKPFVVKADLGLIRQFGIRMQELPLLCRGLLDQIGEPTRGLSLTFTAERMRLHAEHCAVALAAAQARRSRRSLPVNR